MKTSVFLLLGAAMLAGCTNAPISNLPSNVTLTKPQPHYGSKVQMVEAVTFERAGKAKQNPNTCVSLTVENSEVTLSDSAGSFVGPVTGTYYSRGSIRTVGGGSVLRYADIKSGVVIARGVTEYRSGPLIPLAQAVRYRLSVTPLEDKTVLQFKDIEQAQKSTGVVKNTGFGPLGSWIGAGTMAAYEAMKGQSDKVFDCLYADSLLDD
ncbi:hypothetical protein CEK62_11145 [Alcanivorax sp. N3-2A]|nr:hypothetical protein CEK62_11145 [Alcanivorax sp. N3-2A]